MVKVYHLLSDYLKTKHDSNQTLHTTQSHVTVVPASMYFSLNDYQKGGNISEILMIRKIY